MEPGDTPGTPAPSVVRVGVHSSQWPDLARLSLRESLQSRRFNPKLHYESLKQARHWLKLHEAYSPSQRDPDCQEMYNRAFFTAAQAIGHESVQVIGLACGDARKECQLLARLPNAHAQASFVAVDGSWPLVLTARQAATRILPESACDALVCDLTRAKELLPEFNRSPAKGRRRIWTCFGLIPNFEPGIILPQFAALLSPGDQLYLGANLAREPDYSTHLRHILTQYNNAPTREWLFLVLDELGIDRDDGSMQCHIESDPVWDPLVRITIDFVFVRPRLLYLDSDEFRFVRDDRLRLFFSYRYTPSGLRGLLARNNIVVESQWISGPGEEGIFLCRRTPESPR